MDSKLIQRYKNKTVPQLIKIAARHFHKFIRERDKDKPCVSCGEWKTLEAGHFYSGGHYPELRFNEFNVHGQCKRCNGHLHGNLNEYRKSLLERIGEDRLKVLDETTSSWKKNSYKWDRFFLIEIINKYK